MDLICNVLYIITTPTLYLRGKTFTNFWKHLVNFMKIKLKFCHTAAVLINEILVPWIRE